MKLGRRHKKIIEEVQNRMIGVFSVKAPLLVQVQGGPPDPVLNGGY